MGDDALSAGAVARRLGVAVTTLRTWHQRYGLGPSRHVPGHHRRYTAEDLAQLEIMRRLTTEGVAPAEAARWACRAPTNGTPDETWSPGPRSRDGGGGIPVGRAGPAARGLARAAMRLDPVGMGEVITRAITSEGVTATWDLLLRPVLAGVGKRHATTGGLVEVEHLLSRCVSQALAAVPRPPADPGPPRILLSCADEEQHTLPLEALAAALAEAGVSSRLLGARVPVAALVEAVARTNPAVVVVWSHSRATGHAEQLVALLTGPKRPLLALAAGPGWRAESLPAGVVRPTGLAEAAALVIAVRESLGQSTDH